MLMAAMTGGFRKSELASAAVAAGGLSGKTSPFGGCGDTETLGLQAVTGVDGFEPFSLLFKAFFLFFFFVADPGDAAEGEQQRVGSPPK
jgi:hypothetical protein